MTSAKHRDGTYEGLASVREAWRLRGVRKGPPSEADRPRPKERRPRQIPGQLDLFGSGEAAERAAQ